MAASGSEPRQLWHEPATHVARRALGAVGAVAPDGSDRAEEAVVVQVQDRRRAGLARRCERAVAERRMDVVRVDDRRRRSSRTSSPTCVGIEPAAHQPEPAASAELSLLERSSSEIAAGAPAEQIDELRRVALLAAGDAVAVVQHEHALISQSAGHSGRS